MNNKDGIKEQSGPNIKNDDEGRIPPLAPLTTLMQSTIENSLMTGEHKIKQDPETLNIYHKVNGKETITPLRNVFYFIHTEKYVHFYNLDGKELGKISDSLKNLLCSTMDQYIQVHRNCIVRKDCLTGIQQISKVKKVKNKFKTIKTNCAIINSIFHPDIEISRKNINIVNYEIRNNKRRQLEN